MADELREALETAFDSAAESAPETPQNEPEPKAPESDDTSGASEAPPVTEDGASEVKEPPEAKPAESKAAPAKQAAPTSKPAASASSKEEAEPQPDPKFPFKIDAAPNSWRKDFKAQWEKLPPAMRQEITRREHEVYDVMQESARNRERVDMINKVVEPYQDILQHNYQNNPMNALYSALEFERQLIAAPAHTKAQLIGNLIKNYKVDIDTLDQVLSGRLTPETQQITALDKLIESRLAPIQKAFQQQSRASVAPDPDAMREAEVLVESMKNDATRFPHFEHVQNTMADLMEFHSARGTPVTLEQAYTMAVRMDDSLVQPHEVDKVKLALEAHQNAQKAKGAAVSIGGSPSGVGNGKVNPADLRATVASAYTEIVEGNRL